MFWKISALLGKIHTGDPNSTNEQVRIWHHVIGKKNNFVIIVLTALPFKWGENFAWNLMISHKVREIWENGAFWLAETSGHITLEWDSTEMEMMPSFAHHLHTLYAS